MRLHQREFDNEQGNQGDETLDRHPFNFHRGFDAFERYRPKQQAPAPPVDQSDKR